MKEKKVSLSEFEKKSKEEKKSKKSKESKKSKNKEDKKEPSFTISDLSENTKMAIYGCSRALNKENLDSIILSTNIRSCVTKISYIEYFSLEEMRSFVHRTIHEMNKHKLPGESDVMLCFSRREDVDADFFFSKDKDDPSYNVPVNKQKGERIVMTFMGKDNSHLVSFDKVETEEDFVLKEYPSSIYTVSNEKLLIKMNTPFGLKEIAPHFSFTKKMKKEDLYRRVDKEIYKKFVRRE